MLPLPSILIHEYVSGGGWPDPFLPKGLADEGLAMLNALLTDFRAWGGCKTITTRDSRLSHITLPADQIINLDPDRYDSTLKHIARNCSAALVIAPETNGILARISAMIKDRGPVLLGSDPDSIAAAADKWNCHQLFVKAGLPTPDTWCINSLEAEKTAEKIGFPLIIKPVDGVDCEGVSLITDRSSTRAALKNDSFLGKSLLLQQYIKGTPASVTLLVTKNKIKAVSLNRQTIEKKSSFNYTGGQVPFVCDQYQEAISLAKHAATLIPGLKGYVGVDLLVTDNGCYLIEINPRITTSYIGLRRVVNINLAEAIWNAARHQTLPQKISLSGDVIFKKESLI